MMFNLVFVLLALGESSFEARAKKRESLVLTFCHHWTVDSCHLATWWQDRSLLTLHPEPCSTPAKVRSITIFVHYHQKSHYKGSMALQANKQKFH